MEFNKHMTTLALLAALALSAEASSAQTMLISPAEYAQELAARPADDEPLTRGTAKGFDSSGAPHIELRQPTALLELKAPFPIQLVFRAEDGVEIDPASFKVYYGFLKLDITERLLQKVKVTREGLTLSDAAIPTGTHKLLLRVRDAKQREGELQVALKVL